MIEVNLLCERPELIGLCEIKTDHVAIQQNVNNETTYSLALKNRIMMVKMTFLAKSMMKIKAARVLEIEILR